MTRSTNRNRSRRSQDFTTSQNFGEVLKSTREKHGISLAEVSKDLLIREDILTAIEESDFSKIPPQGYSRNMIKSYSRLLGLDANKITNSFLDAEYTYRLGQKQATAKKITDENKKRVPAVPTNYKSKTMTPREQIEKRKQEEKENRCSQSNSETESFLKKRTMHVYGRKYKNTPRARRELDKQDDIKRGRSSDGTTSGLATRQFVYDDNYKTAKERLEERKRRSNMASKGQNPEENPFSEEVTKARRFSASKLRSTIKKKNSKETETSERSKSGYQFMNVYQKKNNAIQSSMTIPVVGIAVIVLFVALILVFFALGKQSENDKTDVSKLNVVGITDIEKNNNAENNDEKTDNTSSSDAPKEVEFKYKAKDGQSVYMEIYENNESRPILARELKSGETNTFKVTGTLKVVTTNPNGVELYVANELVVPQDTSGNGVYTYTVDFNQYIEKWKTQLSNKR